MLYAKDILTSAKAAVHKKPTISEMTKGTVVGASIGALAGLTYAHFREKPIYLHLVGGMLIGGLISRLLIIKK